MSDTICPYPWHAVAIRPNGLTIPCCQYNDKSINIHNSKITDKDIRNSIEWQNIRELQFENKKVDGCSSCYHFESQGIKSLRQMAFDKMPIPKDTKTGDLYFLEIAFSNLCNLACIHCNEFFSTKWYQENYKAGRTIKTPIIQHNVNVEDNLDLSKVKYLKIIGGEPMIEQDRFIKLLDRINLEECYIQVCTNGYVLPNNELTKRLLKAKKLLLVISLDGIDEVNDWCRYPSDWNVFQSMIDNYDYNFGNKENVYLHFHCCVSVYNVFSLKEIVDYVLNTRKNFKLEWDWVINPQWQDISILPNNTKEKLINDFNSFSGQLSDDDLKRLCDVNPYQASINKLKLQSDNKLWEMCIDKTKQFAKERHFPLNNLLSKFYEN